MRDNTARKITLNLSDENFRTVNHLAERLQVNKTTVVNQAIKLEGFIQEVIARGGKLLVVEEDGTKKEVLIR